MGLTSGASVPRGSGSGGAGSARQYGYSTIEEVETAKEEYSLLPAGRNCVPL